MNSAIALGVRPLEVPDPAAGLQRALVLKSLMGQSDLQGLQTQEAQRTLRQNQAMDEAAQGSTSTADYLTRLSKINPGAAVALQGSLLATQKTQGEVAKQQHAEAVQLAQGVLSAPPDQQASVYAQARQMAIDLGHDGARKLPEQWTPQLIPALRQLVSGALTPEQAAERQDVAGAASPAFTALSGGSPSSIQPSQTSGYSQQTQPRKITSDDYRNEASRLRSLGTKSANEQAKEYMAEAGRMDALEQSRKTQQQTVAHQTTMEQQGAEHLKQGWIQTDPFGTLRNAATNFAAKPGAAGVPTTAGSPDAAQSVGAEFLTTIPKPLADQVKALAEGRLAFPAGFALKSPYWQNMLQMVSQYDPTFDAINFNARVATRKDFTSGTAAKSATALNTVIGHLDTLSQAADALANTNLPAYNSITNWIANNTGDPRVKQFENTRKAVADELTRVWRGTGGAEGDIQAWLKTMDAAGSPAQLHGVIKNIGDLLESRIHALEDQYARGIGTTEQGMNLLAPKSRSMLDKLEQKASGNIGGGAQVRNPAQVGDVTARPLASQAGTPQNAIPAEDEIMRDFNSGKINSKEFLRRKTEYYIAHPDEMPK